MNLSDPLQLDLSAPAEGVLLVAFKGKSSPGDLPAFRVSVDARLQPGHNLRRMIFDLSEIDLFMNAAGRLLDLACAYLVKNPNLSIEVRMPAAIYDILREIEPDVMPDPGATKSAVVRGVTVRIVAPATSFGPAGESEDAYESVQPPPAVAEGTTTILSCLGKVRAVNGSIVSVSLFVNGEEIVGEFDRKQFSRAGIVPEMMFEYQALVTTPGRTMVSIDFLTEQYPTIEELMDDAKTLDVDFSKF
jgi:hypothetical protein